MDWLYYLGTKILGLSEEEFYKSTPKKLFKLADIHSKMNNPDAQEEKVEEEKYIDQLF